MIDDARHRHRRVGAQQLLDRHRPDLGLARAVVGGARGAGRDATATSRSTTRWCRCQRPASGCTRPSRSPRAPARRRPACCRRSVIRSSSRGLAMRSSICAGRTRGSSSGPRSRTAGSVSPLSRTPRTHDVNSSAMSSGTPSMVGDDPDRDLLRVIRSRVGLAVVDEPSISWWHRPACPPRTWPPPAARRSAGSVRRCQWCSGGSDVIGGAATPAVRPLDLARRRGPRGCCVT